MDPSKLIVYEIRVLEHTEMHHQIISEDTILKIIPFNITIAEVQDRVHTIILTLGHIHLYMKEAIVMTMYQELIRIRLRAGLKKSLPHSKRESCNDRNYYFESTQNLTGLYDVEMSRSRPRNNGERDFSDYSHLTPRHFNSKPPLLSKPTFREKYSTKEMNIRHRNGIPESAGINRCDSSPITTKSSRSDKENKGLLTINVHSAPSLIPRVTTNRTKTFDLNFDGKIASSTQQSQVKLPLRNYERPIQPVRSKNDVPSQIVSNPSNVTDITDLSDNLSDFKEFQEQVYGEESVARSTEAHLVNDDIYGASAVCKNISSIIISNEEGFEVIEIDNNSPLIEIPC